MIDWGVGSYEPTAEQLRPASELVVERARLSAGERVLDVGCGTGNAALLAAESGVTVIGVDPAMRLLEVGRQRAKERSLDIDFRAGDAAAIPVADGTADVVLSVFGAIFAPDPVAAIAETARVTAPGGRILLTAWLPEGAMLVAAREAEGFIRAALGGQTDDRTPFGWHHPDALRPVFEPLGFTVDSSRERLAFTGRSPRQFVDEVSAPHPMAVTGAAALSGRPDADRLAAEVGDRVFRILDAANEDHTSFRITTDYTLITAHRS